MPQTRGKILSFEEREKKRGQSLVYFEEDDGKFEFHAYYPPFPDCRDEFASSWSSGYARAESAKSSSKVMRERGGGSAIENIHIISRLEGERMDGCRFSVNNTRFE